MAAFYEIDFQFQVDRLTPPFKRKPKIMSYLFALISPLQTNNNSFSSYVDTVVRSTKINGQVIVLDQVLTEFLNIPIGDPRVIIQTFNVEDDFTVGASEDFSSGVFATAAVADAGVYADDSLTKVNFKVKVPSIVWTATTNEQKQQFKEVINKAKLYGTSYIIETY